VEKHYGEEVRSVMNRLISILFGAAEHSLNPIDVPEIDNVSALAKGLR
jgi:hypothetical protein